MTGSSPRDERIGAALRELRVPEHGADFWPRVEAGLRGVPGGRHEPASDRPRRRRLLPRGPSRPALGWTAAAIAAIAAAAVLLIGLPGGKDPQPALATVVKERVAAAIADLRSLEAIVVTRGRGSPHQGVIADRARLSLTSAGDLHLDQRGPHEISYDASTGVVRSVTESASLGFGRFYVVNRGVAPGPPDFPAAPEPVPEARIGAAVRALLASRDPDVREVEHLGRPAWRLVTEVAPNRVYPDVDRLDVIVDQQTGLPVRILASLDGEVVSRVRVTRLRVNVAIPPQRFTVAFPPGAEVTRTDAGFERSTPDEAARIADYDPPLPAWVPPGYRLAEVAVARRTEEATGRLGSNPPSRDVVSASYRRGFDQLVVTARRSGPDPRAWTDPLAEPGMPAVAERTPLDGGRLAGAEARVVMGPRALPHLWAIGDGLVITVGGDASGDELIRVAESL